ncbi:peroxidase family protein [Wenyingzhuangia aestuarii]|uniref:peroxidase family protein n=1 Tax=Wenyingzhuangia aestuarii TaxID=1647582 RepID=UPI0014394205|nr:peroxidase family protein [Wenyingzhuangia aestuarii]NJB82488.1 prostaglandin-endoperoxide synthase 2 [Wenyingzhuangia aestuarii]
MGFNKQLSKWVINSNIQSKPSRPYPFSTYSEIAAPGTMVQRNDRCFFMPDLKNPDAWEVNNYTSWESLKDKTYNNRLLPVAKEEHQQTLPPISKVIDAFIRNGKPMEPCHRTSLLFMGFAQWFTDAFFRIDFKDLRKNTSNHEIDLCQLYGLNKTTTNALRSHKGGTLFSQIIKGKEFPPYLFDENLEVKSAFKELEYISYLPTVYRELWKDDAKKRKFYATGLGRGNSTVSHSTINTLFLRLHNKIARQLEKEYNWGDEQIFQTTRNILIVILIKVVVEDYVNHLKPFKWMKFELDTTYAPKKNWYRNNWISTEFNLLYRWHSMIPDHMQFNGKVYATKDVFRFNNQFVEENSITSILEQLSYQKAGKMTLMNTPDFMKEAELMTLFISRASKLTSYADYCEQFSGSMTKFFNARPKKMSDITKDKDQLSILNSLYDGDVEKVDLVIGALAQDPPKNPLYEEKPILGNLMLQMIASDAFSHALTNPLLSENVFNEQTFSPLGWKLIQQFSSVKSIVDFTEETHSAVNFNYNKVSQKL